MNDESQVAEDAVYSRKVLEFLTVANEYCRFLEKADDYSKGELLAFLQKISPLIYLKASLLPDVTVTDEDATEHFVTEEEWENLFNLLHQKFGEEDIFYFVDPREKSHKDPVRGSLSESFTDVYQDLKDFLLLYQKPLKSNKENAVWDCKRLFGIRFGFKLAMTQAAIHSIMFPAIDTDFDF